MLRNQAQSLLRHEHIQTTVPRAKELRPFVERLITIAKRGAAGEGAADGGRLLHARRLVLRDLQDREVVGKLFDTLALRFAARPGGYTRLLRLGYRRGDSAEMAQIELVGSEYNPKAAPKPAKATEAPKAKGVGGRLRAAADRLRGKKPEAALGEDESKRPERAPSAKPRAVKRIPQKKGT